MNNDRLIRSCFVEGKAYSSDNLNISIDLYKRGLCIENNGSVIFKFTGIVLYGNENYIVFPKEHKVPKNIRDLKKHIHILIKSLVRYKEETAELYDEDIYLGVKGEYLDISVAEWLYNDFLENRLLTYQHKELNYIADGAIHWPYTINKTIPVISNNKLYYTQIISKANKTNLNHIITHIHNFVIADIYEKLNWLLDFTEEVYCDVNLDYDYDLWIHVIELELQKTFVDREIKVLKSLKAYLIGLRSSRKDVPTFILLTQYFQFVWEKISLYAFIPNMLNEIELPNPYWSIENQKYLTKQLPDIMYRYNEGTIILDAKYYNTTYAPSKIPGWKDIVKQIYYRDAAFKNVILNAFLFPGHVDEIGDVFKYFGYASVEGKKDLYGVVDGIILDNATFMANYAYYRGYDFSTDLIKFLEKQPRNQ